MGFQAQTVLVVRQRHLIAELRKTGQWVEKRLAMPKGLTSSKQTLRGMLEECSKLGLSWVRPIVWL